MIKQQSYYDLHLHSEWSWDGQLEIEEYLQYAKKTRIRCIAIADHDTWDCRQEIIKISPRYPDVLCLPAAELYVIAESLGNQWIHLLCYGFDGKPAKELQQLKTRYHDWLSTGGHALLNALQEVLKLPEEKCIKIAEFCSPKKVQKIQGITHASFFNINNALKQCGLQTAQETVKKITDCMWENIPVIPTSVEIIPLLKKAGIKTVLAHPYKFADNTNLLDSLKDELQLDGMECAHTRINPEMSKSLRKYCKNNGLFSTAGSDNHSKQEITNLVGKHGGDNSWLEEFLEHLDVN